MSKLKNILLNNYSVILVVFVSFALLFAQQRGNLGSKNNIIFDMAGYYTYLPATFIWKDLSAKSVENYPEKAWFMYPTETGGHVNKYAIGMSIFLLPFFLLAHGIAHLIDAPLTGFSKPYLAVMYLAPYFYLLLGLYFLRKVLNKFYTDTISNITIITIGLATNLLFYSSIAGLMSHCQLFFTFSAILYLTIKWHEEYKSWQFVIIGLLSGLAVITRPTSVFIVIIPVLYNVNSIKDVISKVQLFWDKKMQVIGAALAGILMLFILLGYWKIATGNWIHYSYGNEGFNFSNPEILQGLFSFQNGLFIYTPILFFALIGFLWSGKHFASFKWAFILFFVFCLYVTFSWWCWWYVGFGMRALIETYALLALPLAATLTELWKQKLTRYTAFICIVGCIGLNIFQMTQFQRGIVYHQGMTWEAYKFVFGKMSLSDEQKKELQRLLKNTKP